MSRPQFLVLSLPRSRSKWLATFLSYGGLECGHDLAAKCGSIAEFIEALRPLVGSCETGAMLAWRLIREKLPWLRLVVIRRPIAEVYHSFAAKGFSVNPEDLVLRDGLLEAIAQQPNVLSFNYHVLGEPAVVAAIFEHCLDLPFDLEWWQELRAKNIQIDLVERFTLLRANAPRLEALKNEIFLESQKLGAPNWQGLH